MEDNKALSSEAIGEIWENSSYALVQDLNSNFDEVAPKFLSFLMEELVHQDEIEVGVFVDEKFDGSLVSYNISDEMKNIHLKLADAGLHLHVSITDGEENIHDYYYRLNDTDTATIPAALISKMKEVKESEDPEMFTFSENN